MTAPQAIGLRPVPCLYCARTFANVSAAATHMRRTHDVAPDLRWYFETRVERADGCWLWRGTRDNNGYGIATVAGRPKKAHRLAYELFVGPIPTGLFICHHCDNPPCVCPDHLFVGDPAANNADMIRKGRVRSLRGEGHQNAKLTDEIVRSILLDPRPYAAQARDLNVSKSTIHLVKTRQIWTHVSAGETA